MKHFLKAILFLPLLASLSAGGEYGLEDIPGMREAVDSFKEATAAMFRLNDITERTSEQDLEFQRLRKGMSYQISRITSCEGSFETCQKYGRSNASVELDMNVFKRRFEATDLIIAELGRPSREPIESIKLFIRLMAGQWAKSSNSQGCK